MIVVGLAAGCFIILAAGYGLALLVLKDLLRINLIECGCLSWLFGVGIVSLLLWVCGIFSSGLALQGIVTAICIGLGLIGWRTQQQARPRFELPLPETWVEWALAIMIALEIATVTFVSFKHTLGWDGLLNWEIKARYAFFGNGVLPGNYYSSSGRGFSHPEYPLAIPFAELWLYLWMGEPHQLFVKIIFPLFYAAGACLLVLFIARLTGKHWIGLMIGVLLPLVPFVTAGAGGAIVGYADFPIGVVYLAAVGYLLQYVIDARSPWLHCFTVCLALLPWIKSDGIILWAILAVIVCAVFISKKQLGICALALAPGLVIIGAWKLYLAMMHAVHPADFARPTFGLLRGHIDRIGAIMWILWAETTDTSDWSLLWLLAAVAICYLLVQRRLEYFILVIGVIAPIVLYSLTYIFSAWPSFTAHMTSSIPRLLFQIVPVAWLAVGIAVALPKNRVE